MTADTIEARVARGVAVLDEQRPGWHDHIDLDLLDLRSSDACILGQEFYGDTEEDEYEGGWDGFNLGAVDLLGDVHVAVEYGFDGDPDSDEDDFPALTAEWKRIIRARRGEAS